MHLHWDGDNDSVDERNLSAGARRRHHAGDRRSRRPEARARLDLDAAAAGLSVSRSTQALAARGAARLSAALRRAATRDHRFRDGVNAGDRVGQVEDDRPHRHRSPSARFLHRRRSPPTSTGCIPDSPYRFTHFRKTHGYANHPLDGIWLRGPYLHNGSVPTLRDLLEPPARRPAVFYRGYDVFDQRRRRASSRTSPSRAADASPATTRPCPATATCGHLYGTTLPDADKAADRGIPEDVLTGATSATMINDTDRRPLVQTRDVAGHRWPTWRWRCRPSRRRT